jgi:AraC-like DNA-binding protein
MEKYRLYPAKTPGIYHVEARRFPEYKEVMQRIGIDSVVLIPRRAFSEYRTRIDRPGFVFATTTRGTCDYFARGDWRPLGPDTAILMHTDGKEGVRSSDNANASLLIIRYRPEVWSHVVEPLLVRHNLDIGQLALLVELLFETARAQRPTELIQGYLQCIHALVTEPFPKPAAKYRGLTTLWDAIRETPDADWSLPSMAEFLDVSERTLYRHVRRVTGKTPAAQVEQIRMKLATESLAQPGATVRETARRLGYSDYHVFSKAFRRVHGRSAGECKPNSPAIPVKTEEMDRNISAPSSAFHVMSAAPRSFDCPFPAVQNAEANALQPIPLASITNCYRQSGDNPWFGSLPLRNLLPGLQRFRFVPFDILDEKRGPSGMTVDARHWRHLDPPRHYPSEIIIPLNKSVERVYFLHTAGYIEDEELLGHYELVYGDKRLKLGVVPLQPLYRPEARPVGWPARATIQDWWENWPQFENNHNVCVPVPQYEHALTAFLYITEWINPRPDKPIREIRFCSEPGAWGAVLLLGITCLAMTCPS